MKIDFRLVFSALGMMVMFTGMAAADSADIRIPAVMVIAGGIVMIKSAPRC